MKWFYNLKISAKLLISFFIVALIAGVVGIIGISNIKNIQSLDEEMYVRQVSTFDDLAVVLADYEEIRATIRDLFILTDSAEKQKRIEQFKSLQQDINTRMGIFEKEINDDKVRENFDNLKKAMNDLFAYEQNIINLLNSNQVDKANISLYSDGTQIAKAVQTAGDNLMKLKVDTAKKSANSNSSSANTATMIMIIVIAIGVLIAIILGIFIARINSKPVKKMVDIAEKLAVGEVNVNVEVNTKDEIGSLASSFAKMITSMREQALIAERIADGDLTAEVNVKSENDLLGRKLSDMVEKNNEVMTNIASASEQVASGAKQVSASSVALSQGATEQASSIEELTASIEEISSQTKLNAENANQANELAGTVKLNAEQGNTQMKEMLKAMEEINDASTNISKIIKVIDDIAFQTNILALNAAVEAARAGQHGKGFAVVAEEVRNLAARSANAAKETTDMIEGSIKKVEGGTKIAKETADALKQMVNGIEKVANLIHGINVASNEQATGIAQINQGIMQVSQVVQTISATSEESASASEELSSQAELLKEMVDKFKLKETAQSYSKLDGLSPEVLKMLDRISEKKNGRLNSIESAREEVAVSKPKIVLSDREFGKY